MIYPEFPRAGQTVGICAPSAGVGHKLESFDLSLDTLKTQGWNIVETASVRNNDIRSNTAEIRGQEFNQLAADPEVRAILSASGGDYNLEMLPYIDPDLLLRDPKWIAGASDPTNILYYVTTKLDIATLYGYNAGSFDWRPLHPFLENAMKITGGVLVRQDSFDKYDDDRTFSDDGPNLNADVYWDIQTLDASGQHVNGGRIDLQGRLLGGCIDCISKLIGTPFDGTNDFLDRYDDVIWFFDNFALSADDLYLTLLQMKHCGYFRSTRAVIFGRTMFLGGSDEDYIERLRRVLDVPFIWNADIGHVKPCMTVINGAIGHLVAEDGRGSLEMSLR